jgi:glycosyltransferase involved in cell wall biosynthesis
LAKVSSEGASKSRVVVCIPALNAERSIGSVVVRALAKAGQVIVCDDGSTDLTGAIAEKLGAKVITHPRNMGKGEALRSLFLAARDTRADAVVTLDSDGQHDPSEIPTLVEPILQGKADVVIGSRFMKDGNKVPAYRKIGNEMLNSITLKTVSDTQSGYRAYSARAVREILPSEMGMGVDSEILMEAARLGMEIAEVPVSVSYEEEKTSVHNPLYHTLDVIFSIVKLVAIRHPLLFFGIPGLALAGAGVFLAFRTLSTVSAQGIVTNLTITYGLLSLAVLLLGLLTFFVGVILFTLATLIRKNA